MYTANKNVYTYIYIHTIFNSIWPHGFWGEGLFSFRELGSNGNCLWELGSELKVWGT